MNSKLVRRSKSKQNGRPQPAWDVALLYPNQGVWTEEDYFALETNHLVELSDGRIEVLPMPTPLHQWIVLYLYRLLHAFAEPKLGLVLTAPLPVRLWPGKIREPDVVLMLRKNRGRIAERYWNAPDLAMEVVSEEKKGRQGRRRDLVEKRAEYARAGIGEYWIVDPKKREIIVLCLKGQAYEVHGVFKKGMASSRLLPGFMLEVACVFSGPEL